MNRLLVASAALIGALACAPAHAAVNIYDEGPIPETSTGMAYGGTITGSGALGTYTDYWKFSVTGDIADITISVTESDSVRHGAPLPTGALYLYQTAANPTGIALAPTAAGPALASAALAPLGSPTTEGAGFGPISTTNSPNPYFFVELTGQGATGRSLSVVVDGTITPAAIPEPSTWALMFLGFAGVAYAAARRPLARLA